MTLARWVAFGQLAGMKVSISLLLSFSLSLARSLFLFYYYVTSSVNFFSFSSFSCEIPREVSRYVLKMLGNRKMHVEVETITFGLDKANRFSFLLLLLFFSPLSQGNSNSSSKFSREWKLLQGGIKVFAGIIKFCESHRCKTETITSA